MGDSVRLARLDVFDAGYVAVFDVAGVRGLRDSSPDMGRDLSQADIPSRPMNLDGGLTFLFEDGGPATLRVLVQKPTPRKPDPASSASGTMPDW